MINSLSVRHGIFFFFWNFSVILQFGIIKQLIEILKYTLIMEVHIWFQKTLSTSVVLEIILLRLHSICIGLTLSTLVPNVLSKRKVFYLFMSEQKSSQKIGYLILYEITRVLNQQRTVFSNHYYCHYPKCGSQFSELFIYKNKHSVIFHDQMWSIFVCMTKPLFYTN